MESEYTNILESIRALIGCDLCYILECNGTKNSIIKSCGTISALDKNFSFFNKLLSDCRIISNNSLKQTKEFISIRKKHGLEYFHKKKIYKSESVNYYLIIFSHLKLPGLKNLEIKISKQIDLLKTALSGDKMNEISRDFVKTNANGLQQNIIDTIADIQIIIYSLNAINFKFDFITEAVRNLFGYFPEEIYNNKSLFLKSIHKDDFRKFKNFIRTLKNSSEAVAE